MLGRPVCRLAQVVTASQFRARATAVPKGCTRVFTVLTCCCHVESLGTSPWIHMRERQFHAGHIAFWGGKFKENWGSPPTFPKSVTRSADRSFRPRLRS